MSDYIEPSNTQAEEKPRAFSRMDRSFLGMWWWTVDRGILGAILAMLVVGVALVASASPSVAQKIGVGDYHFLKKHMVFLVPSVFMLISLSMFSPRYIWRFASLLLIATCVMMVMVLVTGVEVKGARRWLTLLGFSIQPSEILKPAFAVVVAWLIALEKESLQKSGAYHTEERGVKTFPGYYIAVGLYFVMIVLLLMQPDLGMSVVLTCVFAVQIFLAGLRFRYLAILIALGAGGLMMAYASFHHVRSRIDRFLNPESGDNYQVDRSLDAIKNGGIIGVGPGQGTEKVNIPDAHADFIFSVFVEEMGLIFTLALIGLFLFVLLRGFKSLRYTQDVFPVLAAGGLLSMFGFQSLIHMGSAVSILPAKGMTLPFMSYGGSSMLAMSIAMGMVLALTRKRRRGAIARSSFGAPR